MQSVEQRITELITGPIAALGCELWGCCFFPQHRPCLLRVYIDKPEGIVLEDCERVSKQISAILDVHDPITMEYNLEVSSPGLERPLFTLAQITRYIGSAMAITLRIPINGRKRYRGILQAVENGQLEFLVEDQEEQPVFLPFAQIDKAKLVWMKN